MALDKKFVNESNKMSFSVVILILCLVFLCGATIAYFFDSDWSSGVTQMSGKVLIEAVGEGDVSIEDTHISKLTIGLDDGYTVLIPGMDLDIVANCKVSKSTTKPLMRASLKMKILDTVSMRDHPDDLRVAQDLYGQLQDIAEDNNWYLHTDSYYYYVGSNSQNLVGGGTILEEVDATHDNTVVNFIDKNIKFPTYVTSAYSGFGVKFVIEFQAIQNFIPDVNGNRMDNTINNSLKIFNSFGEEDLVQTPLSYFEVTTVDGKVTINKKDGVEYPETIVLPTHDSTGNAITNISSSFGDIECETLIIPSTYSTIDAGCFENNTTIQNLDLSRTTITEIPENCFKGSNIESVELPSTLKVISKNAFRDSQLESIILNDGLEEIHAESFQNVNIVSLYIPASVNYISTHQIVIRSETLTKIVVDEANPIFFDIDDSCVLSADRFIKFAPMNPKKEFTIPEGVKYMSYGAFYACEYLEKVNLPTTMQEVSQEGFRYSYNLSKINVQSAVTYAEHSLDYTKISELTLNYSVIRKTIEYASLLKKVTFASNVTSVADIVVANCSAVEVFIFESTVPPTFATSTFCSGASNFKIYVPDSAVSAYKNVANLSSYVSKIYPISQYAG